MGSGGEEDVTVAVPLPRRVVDVVAEPVMTVVDSVEVEEVAFEAITVLPEAELANVDLEVFVWDEPVGVVGEALDSDFVPEMSVMPDVVDEDCC